MPTAADVDRRAVTRGAVAAPRREQLVGIGVVDDADLDLTPVDIGERDAPHRQPVNEVEGAVNRIDDPQPLGQRRATARGPVLLAKHAVAKVVAEPIADQALDGEIGLC